MVDQHYMIVIFVKGVATTRLQAAGMSFCLLCLFISKLLWSPLLLSALMHSLDILRRLFLVPESKTPNTMDLAHFVEAFMVQIHPEAAPTWKEMTKPVVFNFASLCVKQLPRSHLQLLAIPYRGSSPMNNGEDHRRIALLAKPRQCKTRYSTLASQETIVHIVSRHQYSSHWLGRCSTSWLPLSPQRHYSCPDLDF